LLLLYFPLLLQFHLLHLPILGVLVQEPPSLPLAVIHHKRTVLFAAGVLCPAQTGDYPVAGTYTVRIQDNTGLSTGFPRIFFYDHGDRRKLLTIEQWGTGKWTSMNKAFFGCENLAEQASDSPDLSAVTDLSFMFTYANAFKQDISSWNTANVTNMSNSPYAARRTGLRSCKAA